MNVRWILILATLLTSAALAGAQEKPIAPKEVIKLFNGKDLTGLTTWLKDTKRDDPRKVFTVKDGILQLSGPRDIAYSDIAAHLARSLGADPALVEPVSAYSAGLPPGSTAQHTTLDSSALRERFGIRVPDPWTVIDELLETCR